MSAWVGGLLGAAIGGTVGFFAMRTFAKRADVGVTAAAAGAGFLIGAAITAPGAAADTAKAQAPTPTPSPILQPTISTASRAAALAPLHVLR